MVSEEEFFPRFESWSVSVLILVVVEDGLGDCWKLSQQYSLCWVLILVVVEDGLGVAEKCLYSTNCPVS